MKQSHAADDNLKDDLIRRTRQFWRRLSRDLGSEDARQITENLTGFFALLAKWSQAEAATAANDNDIGLSTNLIIKEKQPTGGSDREGPGHD